MDSLGHPLSSVAFEPSSFSSTALPVESATHLMASAFSHGDPFRVARPYPTNPTPQLAVDTSQQRSAFRPILSTTPSTMASTATTTSCDSFITMALNMLVHQNEHGEGNSSGDSGSSIDSASSTSLLDPSKASLLCQICSDRASGFHYGVFACEGCKGFFRRSIQQKIQYRPCSKSQQCAIVRNNRNRCQYCRLKKCVSVGMSRDAVRFGRVPKREKVKMVEEMQRASVRSSMDALAVEMEDEMAFVVSIERGFSLLGEFIREHTSTARKFLDALPPSAVSSTTKSECPLEAVNHVAVLQAIVEFSKAIPGFHLLHVKDSVHLLKASLFQVLLLRLASMLKPGVDRATSRQDFLFLANGISGESGRFLHDSVGDFVQRFRLFELNERKMAIFAAYVMVQPDNVSSTSNYHHPGLVKMLQDKLYDLLIRALCPHDPLPVPFCAFHHVNNRLVMDSIHAVLTDLKTLHTLHQERLQAIQFPMAPATPGGLLIAQPQLKPTDMPCLRRALQQTSALGVGSFVDRHRTVADALSRPPPPLAQPRPVEDDEDEQPLNLCIRKV